MFLRRLIWLSILPLMLLSLWLVVDTLRARHQQDLRHAAMLAGNFATDLDQFLASRIGALQMLGNSPLMEDRSRWPELYQEARAYQSFFGSHVILAEIGRPMPMLFNTKLPLGSKLPALPIPKGKAAAPAAVASGKPEVGDVIVGPVNKVPLCSIAVPIRRGNHTQYVLLTLLETSLLQQRIDRRLLPAGWSIAVKDSSGQLIARRSGANHQETDAANRVVVKSELAPWTVELEIPKVAYRGPWVRFAILLVLGLLVTTVAGVLGGSIAAGHLGRAVRGLVQPGPAPPTKVAEIAEIAEAREFLEQVAAAKRESEERQEVFIEHAPAALAMFDRQMRYLHVSQRWLRDYGMEGRDIIGMSHYEIFPEISAEWREFHKRGLAGEVIRSEADRFDRADGSVQWVRWEIRPWRLAGGGIGGIVLFSEDISDLKKAQDEIQSLNTDLERRVELRTAELKAANQELDAFAYAVSHDLRAPLRAMIGFSEALREDCAAQLSEEGLDHLHEIQTAGYRMGELVDGLLVLSRSLRGTLECQLVDVSALAQRLLKDLERAEPNRMVRWQIEEGLQVNGDPRMVEMLLTNLLSNAWKYSATASTPRITVSSERRDGRHFITVADNGAGFDMRHAERLFKPFQRLHRQDEFPGIGIGLATVQRIVNRHGGAIEADGEPGKGATFRFWLPS
ncbi:sensor histidine kinase [Geomonas agri]|uniref:sensor histidine kinase n=1 Tax=Geomonas agri TaxID=2873702 RepID=UPI001CD5FA68|nr:ATP-binding protein [Geomonas agri]